MAKDQDTTKNEVQEYYGKTLQQSSDLKTNACCTVDVYPPHIKETLKQIHGEVLERYYGCGLTIPNNLEGTSVLDLGSGAGRDCYILSKLVGENGEVVGVDMTPEQLEVANRHLDFHKEAFGHKNSNVRFLEGDIEKLDQLDLKDDCFDVIVSNCVINLATDKEAVLRESFRTLKPGGELYFSDVYSDRRVPADLVKDPVLYGECLSGALYWNDFINLAKKVGFNDPRMVEWAPITIENAEVQKKVGNITFFSVTYRLFKLPELEPACEDYGQAVMYKGSIEESPNEFTLDDHHVFPKGQALNVCGNTYSMLKDSRFSKHFDFMGDMSTHLGIFEGCGSDAPFNSESTKTASTGSSCC